MFVPRVLLYCRAHQACQARIAVLPVVRGCGAPCRTHVKLFCAAGNQLRLHMSQVWLRCFASLGTLLQPRPAGKCALSHAR